VSGRRAAARGNMSLGARAAILLIGVYRYTLSALLGRTCRFLPTCSAYAAEAIGRHGLWLGGRLALVRIARCHPWGGSGYDPVPDHPIAGRSRPRAFSGCAAPTPCGTGSRDAATVPPTTLP
jgi:putative membrane protein insertion efficiency factor